MNQFKDIFTGQRKVDYKRATSSQKCIRAGGKHNDLDMVGFTARHHTFFEMLGNFSFGDYFKEEAIAYAWEWVTKDLQLPKDRLYATVYDDDNDAFKLWEKIAPELKGGRVMRFGKKDNYWSMGDVGPCGPCSEIHFDRGEKYGTGPNDVVNGDTERFVEIWNLVFMQFDQFPDGKIVPLPKPSVDTGAGLERIAAIVQNVESNFTIDLFRGLIEAISDITKSKYRDHVASHHVIADHVRTLAFSIADGAGISNEGRGYVLRRILRRAARHGRLLGAHDPFIHKLVPVLVDEMGDTYPELREKRDHIVNVIRAEEEAFGRTLETGLELFDKIAKKVRATGETVVDGADVFKLYDTYGFPYDLTEILAGEQSLTLDQTGFDRAMGAQQEQSKAASGFAVLEGAKKYIDSLEQKGLAQEMTTDFVRDNLQVFTTLQICTYHPFPEVAVVLERTPFYAEAGGQASDTGRIYGESLTIEVSSMFNHQDYYIHVGRVTRGTLRDLMPPVQVTAEVDAERRWDIMRNHTATHLAHAALRKVLGNHVRQSGSYVGPDRLRFDFSHHQPMTPDEIAQVEKIVNEQILQGAVVDTNEMNVEEAKKAGAMALFGEKYGDKVRVVSVPGISMELCGGTHVENINQIGPFFVLLETGIASGVRRLEAITGRKAIECMLDAKEFKHCVSQLVGRPEAEALKGLEQLKESHLALQKELKKTRAAMFAGADKSIGNRSTIGPLLFLTHDFGATDRETMGAWIDNQKESSKPLVAVGLGDVNGKMTVMVTASGSAARVHDLHVGDIAKEVLPQFGGRGGGKPSFAQGSTAAGTAPQDLFDTFKTILKEKVGVANE